MFIYKDYQIVNNTLVKKGMRSVHLLHMPPYLNTPAIDKDNVWDKHKNKIENIKFEVELKNRRKRIFYSSRENFEANMRELDFGYGRQLAMPYEFWGIEETQVDALF